jgi:hypothetical protein
LLETDRTEINENTRKGYALHMGVCLGNLKVIDLLMQYGADPELKDDHGLNAFDVATDPKVIEVIKNKRESYMFGAEFMEENGSEKANSFKKN